VGGEVAFKKWRARGGCFYYSGKTKGEPEAAGNVFLPHLGPYTLQGSAAKGKSIFGAMNANTRKNWLWEIGEGNSNH